MNFKHRRGSFHIIFEKVIELPILIIGALVSIFLIKNFDFQVVLPLIVVLINPITRLINYLSTFYTLDEGQLIIESGVLTKKRIVIPFSTITTVDLSQNILFQILKVYKIKVDNSSQTNDTANQSKIVLTLKIDEAIRFKNVITNGLVAQDQVGEDAEAIKAAPLDFIKLGLFQSKMVYFFSVCAVIGPFVGIIAPKFQDVFKNVLIAGLIAGAIIFGYMLAVVFSLIKSVGTYYNFKVWSSGDSVKISYGLLNKKSFSLKKEKINGVILKQNLLMRITGLYTAEVIVIGYGDTKQGEAEQAIIFPIASYARLKSIINRLLPEYSFDYTLSKPNKTALKYFFVSFDFISALVLAFIAVPAALILQRYVVIVVAVAGVILCLSVVSCLLKFANAGISVEVKNVVLSMGGFRKRIAVIRTDSIESVTARGSIFKRRKGFVSISLGYLAPARASRLSSGSLPAEQFELLEGVLKY